MPMGPEIAELEMEYVALYRKMTGSDASPQVHTERSDSGAPHVEFTAGKYHYVVTERGLELSRRIASDKTEMLYWLLSDIAFWMGSKYEFENRVPKQDCRRMIFAEWQRLVERLGSPYAEMNAEKIESILKENPFDDSLF